MFIDSALSSTPDRRSSARIKIDSDITWHRLGRSESFEGKLEDLSNTGARIWIDDDLKMNSQLVIRAEDENSSEPAIEMIVRILHSVPDQKGDLHGYGCSVVRD